MNNLAKRTLSALVMIPAALGAVWAGGWLFKILLLAATVLMYWEWKTLVLSKKPETTGKVSTRRMAWFAAGAVYIALPVIAVAYIRLHHIPMCAPVLAALAPCDTELKDPSAYPLIWLLAVVWATDIGAYIFGRLIGGPKLASRISPKKTWAGLIGGMLCAGAVAELLLRSTDFWQVIVILPIRPFTVGLLLAVVAQAGDLFESWVKRHYGVKDSGALIPGHGGLLDRVDGLMFASIVFAILMYDVFGI